MATYNARTDATNRDVSKRRAGKKMSDNQLTGLIGRKVHQAMNDEDGDLSDARQDYFDRYFGDLYGNERDGYSKFTTREVLETVEWVLPSVLRVFLGSDRVVSYDPVNMEDEEQAEQETDIVNHAILKANDGDGFLALHHWCKDTLVNPVGYIKIDVVEEEKTETQKYTGIDELALARLVEDEEVEILEQDTRTEMIDVRDPATGMPFQAPMEVFDIRLRRTYSQNKMRLMPVPPEQALIDNDCSSTNLDTADFVCHRVERPFTELVNEGYDPELLNSIGTSEDHQYNDERVNRRFYEDEDPDAEDEDDESMRTFWVHDCYLWVDYDGDGIAELRNVIVIGRTIFKNEPVDFQPLVAMSSILIPHKHNGVSLAEIVVDLQELMTTLTRQALDSIYRFNVGRKYISEDMLVEDGSTMEALLNTQSEFVPVRGAPQQGVMEEQRTSILGDIIPMLQRMDEQRQLRTGVAPNLTLDPEVLQQSTMGAFMGAIDQASQRIEMLVRILAETGWKQLFRKAHQLTKQNPDIVSAVKLRGQWIQDPDPESWRDRTSVTVNVGLGFNNKQQMLTLLTQLLGLQQEALPAGLTGPDKIYNTLEQIVTSAGLGEATRYFNDPTAPDYQPPQPQPDPQAILAEAQANALTSKSQTEQAELQIKAQADQAKLQSDQQKAMLDMRKSQVDLEMKMRELEMKERELEIKRAEMEMKLRLEGQKMRADIDNTDADTVLKSEQAFKARADAVATAVDADDTVQKAREILDGEDVVADIEAESEDGE